MEITYQKLRTVLESQPNNWLWSDVSTELSTIIGPIAENYFSERYINSIYPDIFKKQFTSYCNVFEKQFLRMYDLYVSDVDPLIYRKYHEEYTNQLTRDNTHNTTTNNKRTDDLKDNATRTDNLKTVQNSDSTRTDNLQQKHDSSSTRTDDLNDFTQHTGTQTLEYDTTETDDTTSTGTNTQSTKNLHSDMPQSNVASSTTGFPNVTWTYASDMQDGNVSENTSATGNNTATKTGDDKTIYDEDVDVMHTGTQETETSETTSNTGTQTTKNNSTTDNTGTQTNSVTHTGSQVTDGTTNAKIDDNENGNGTKDITEYGNMADIYSKYWTYLADSNPLLWLLKKLDVCFLGILSSELESEYYGIYY